MTKKFFTVACCLCMAAGVFAQTYSGGDGSEGNPYKISNAGDMADLAAAVNGGNTYQGKYFLLTADLTGITTVIGDAESHPFVGHFDGGGYVLTVNINASGSYAGVFGYVGLATIRNLGVAGSVTGTLAGWYVYAGGICGRARGMEISNCYNTAAISLTHADDGFAAYAGGICGYADNSSSIGNCYNTGAVSVTAFASSLMAAAYAGGICGEFKGASISNCYNTAAITADGKITAAGGICGNASSLVTNCFAANGSITVISTLSGHARRVVGYADGAATLTNNYALATMNATVNSNPESAADPGTGGKDGEGALMDDFKDLNWLEGTLGWDVSEWYIPGGSGQFPTLKADPEFSLTLSANSVTYGDAVTFTFGSKNIAMEVNYEIEGTGDVEINKLENKVILKKAGTVTITAKQAGTDTYKSGTATATLTINKAPLTITGKSETMTYGGPLPSAYTCTYSGFVNGEDETTSGVLSNLPTVDCTATATDNVGGYPITVSGATADNYDITHTPGTLTINKKSLTVTPNPAITSREYGANNPTFTVTYSNDFVNGDDADDINIPPQASCTAATLTSNVGSYTIITSGGSADNYDFIYDEGTLEITKAPLEIETNSDSRIYGVPNPTFTFSFDGFKNSEDETVLDNLTAICGATLASPVGPYQITFSVDAATNYTIVPVYGELTINKAPLTITGKSETMTYGGTLPSAYTCEYVGFVNGEDETTPGVLSNLPTVDCTATAADNAGGYPITVSGATADNYDITQNPGTLTINKKSLTVTPNPAITSREYGANNPTFTVTYSNDFVNGDDAGDITTHPQASCTAATLTSDVGNYQITVTGGVADNYDFIYDTGTLEITQAPLKITANNLSRAYGAANPTFTFSFDGFKNSEDERILNNLEAACSATVASGVGQYPITVSVGAATNYAISTFDGELSVTQATLVVTAKPTSRTYGEANPTFEFSYTGFVNGNDETVLLTRPQADCAATPASGAGNYTIYVSGGSATNYSLAHTNGTLTINKAPLSVSGYDAYRNYGESNPTFFLAYAGFVNGDNEYSLTTRPQANCTATATSNAGYYSINISGGVAANYDFAYYPGVLFINKAPLTVTANDATRLWGEDNPAFSLSYSGFRNNETESVLDVLPAISCVAEKTSPTGFYDILLSGGSDNNYNYSLINGRLEVTSPTGIEAVAASGVSVYPNPVRHDMYVRSASPVEKIEIYNQAGILVLVDRICSGKTDVSRLAAGVHFVRVYVKGKVETKKVMVRK